MNTAFAPPTNSVESPSRVTNDRCDIPTVQKHKPKDGNSSLAIHSLDDVSLSRISETISQAEAPAKSHVESLGMAGLLKAHKLRDNLPVCPDNSDSDSDFHEEDEIPNVTELNLLALEITVEMLLRLKMTSKPYLLVI